MNLAAMPYIKYMDADDLLVENAVETLLTAIHGTDSCAVFGIGKPYQDRFVLGVAEGVLPIGPAEPAADELVVALPRRRVGY